MATIRSIAKALAAFLSALAASLAAGQASGGLDSAGTTVALVGALAAGLITWTTPNRPADLLLGGQPDE